VKPEAFLPDILLKHDREKPWQEWLTGTVLFSDVSGFTPMSEAYPPSGAEGELVLTTLTKEAFPVVRYRTRDMTSLDYSPCPCGRTLVRMKKVWDGVTTSS
jgi:hypothetical protein